MQASERAWAAVFWVVKHALSADRTSANSDLLVRSFVLASGEHRNDAVGQKRTEKKTSLSKFKRIITSMDFSDYLIHTYIQIYICLLYTSPSPRDRQKSRMPSSA